MRIIFLLLFGYLVYRFLIRPVFIGIQGPSMDQKRAQMAEMLRRMQNHYQQQQHHHYQQPQHQEQQSYQQQNQAKQPKKRDDGEYIDFEEIE